MEFTGIKSASDLLNTDMNHELQYNTVEQSREALLSRNVPLLNDEQGIVFTCIMLAVSAGQGRILFFFWMHQIDLLERSLTVLLAEIRSKWHRIGHLRHSGIAATLLDGGRTKPFSI
ncbi:hypothetical protein AVEN_78902-1 [Araneus ventricosus]|uniref:Uncharacterized protein n=1 Tax=Araneus ventricosus TaxID=182803 RepID=A0A4Y2SIP6_ARAVE|nr:hypothetical protein AVEN_78902-1 [Araneus ventricosus]